MNSSWLCCASCELPRTAVPWARALTAQLSAGAAVPAHCRLLTRCPRVTQGLQKQHHCSMAFQEQAGQLLWAQLALDSGSVISLAAESKMRNTIVLGGSCWHHLAPVLCQSHRQFCRVSCLLLSSHFPGMLSGCLQPRCLALPANKLLLQLPHWLLPLKCGLPYAGNPSICWELQRRAAKDRIHWTVRRCLGCERYGGEGWFFKNIFNRITKWTSERC